MKFSKELVAQMRRDLGLDVPFVKGVDTAVYNCWHFTTDGNAVDSVFNDDKDFIDGMNRIYVVVSLFNVVILAFSLMDTHVHFVLYGNLEECNRFMYEYVRRTSIAISNRYGKQHKLEDVPIHFQQIDTSVYLKTCICYVIKNPPVAGMHFMGWDYPWSSGPLLFRSTGYWCSPMWDESKGSLLNLSFKSKRTYLKTRIIDAYKARTVGEIVFPGEYVAWELVEQIFKTAKSFNYFMCVSRESDVDARGGSISRLSIPMQEMRLHKNEMCKTMFGVNDIRSLDTSKRIRLAKALKAKYNSSTKQIVRLCGLVYNEVKDMI